MRPYLVIKGEQADLGIEFQQMKIKRMKSKVPGWLNIKREEHFQKMKSLHH
jgi:hypothetical protein